MAISVQSGYHVRQLTRNVVLLKQSEHSTRHLPIRNMSSFEQAAHRNSNNDINLRWLKYFLMILLVAVKICICSEVPSTNQNESYERQAEGDTSLYHIDGHPSNESTGRYREDNCSKNNATCNKGCYLDAQKGGCIPCPENTFMPYDNHTYLECIKCIVEQHSHQTMEWQNATHAPIFGCEYGYHKGDLRLDLCNKSECDKCKNCSAVNQYERRSCSNNSDTLCCKDEDMIVESNSSVCTRKATTPSPLPANSTSAVKRKVCGRNYYVDNINNTCKPCPPNTYLDKDNHTTEVCQSVEATSPGNRHIGKAVGIAVGLLSIVVLSIYVYRRYRRRPERNGIEAGQSFIQTDTGSMKGTYK